MALELAGAESGTGRPVLVLHGLFGSATNWHAIARRLAERRHVFALDLRNHGASPWAERMDYPAMADDVAAFIAIRGLAPAGILGHSMGGKTGMVLALTQPSLVERLVVVDIAPVAHAPTNDVYVAAMKSLDLDRVTRRAEADTALRPHIPDDAIRQFLLQNLVATPAGMRWRVNLDAISAGMADLTGFPAFPAGATYSGQTLVVRGGESDYVRDRDLPGFRRLFPALRLATIAGAGHWVHAERSADFLAAVIPFLAAS